MEIKKIGKVLLVDGALVFLAKGTKIYKSLDDGESWEFFSDVPASFTDRLFCKFDIFRRLMRKGIHHMVPGKQGSYYIIFGKDIYVLSAAGEIRKVKFSIKGGRPLCVAGGEQLLYGEYFDNPERAAAKLIKVGDRGEEVFAEFDNVRHIHGVFWDQYSKKYWVTTGDYGEEAAIWFQADERFLPVVAGSQQTRAVQLLFDRDFVYFASDSPLENNYIYKMDRSTGEVFELQAVASSVFYGIRVSDKFFFSTVAEPSDVNRDDLVELWGAGVGQKWVLLAEFTKDKLPHKLFQYGQLNFPFYASDSRYLWFYKMGVRGSGTSVRVKL